jgi:hypothetical protein
MADLLPHGVFPEPQTTRFYLEALTVLRRADVPHLVGGAYALTHYTGIARHSKDLDIFVRPADAPRALDVLNRAGFRSEMTFPHWLGKALHGDDFVDIIFSSGNGLCTVDDRWFAHAVPGLVLGEPAPLCPVEEILWQKAFIMERERFDGADVLHLLRSRGPKLDWDRLLERFGPHWPVLLSHLVLFQFVYPSEKEAIPQRVWTELLPRLREETNAASTREKVCRGTLLSRVQYLNDIESSGYEDARLPPQGPMTSEQIIHWTAAANG